MNGSEPLARLYTPAYFRATYIFTALDVGFWTAMNVRPKFLRDSLSILFTGLYLCLPHLADEKLRRIQRTATVEHMRVGWNKSHNPYLRLLTHFNYTPVDLCRTLTLDRPARLRPHQPYLRDHPFEVKVFFAGSPAQFRTARSVLYHVPGGGFVAMDPSCHEDYLRIWAKQLGVPVVSINYRKAPEFPFPFALEECFDFYRLLVETNGACIGLAGWHDAEDANSPVDPIRISLVGDSAGGNLAAGVTLQILEFPDLTISIPRGELTRLPRPAGLLLVYGCFDFNFTSWMSGQDYQRMRNMSSDERLPSMLATRDHLHHRSPLATRPDTHSRWRRRHGPTIADRVVVFDPQEAAALSRTTSAQYLGGGGSTAGTEAGEASTPALSDAEEVATVVTTTTQATREKSEQRSHDLVGAKPTRTRLAMSSRSCFINDRLLPADLQRAMAILYIGPNNRPDFSRNYYISPVVAPDHLLAQFPHTCFVCGEKDPLVDDTIVLAARIREAKHRLATRLSTVEAEGHCNSGKENRGKPTSQRRHRSFANRHALTPLDVAGAPKSDPQVAVHFFTGGHPEESEMSDVEPPSMFAASAATDGNGTASAVQVEANPSGKWHDLLTGTDCAQLETHLDTTTHVQIIEGISHGFLNMLAVYPPAREYIDYMAAGILREFVNPTESVSADGPGLDSPALVDTKDNNQVAGSAAPSSTGQQPSPSAARATRPFSPPAFPIPGSVPTSSLVSRRRADLAAALGAIPLSSPGP
ncbi:hypothetical protein IWQ60_004175 [Tieghemiomyces parasiticus]|uniref:Alpha/beta hydrolase fold-3 domain-containing protein n=1 Tax=Tieghemiomyces parasiticus TaxID=78921 RepID=A0A9W8AGN3_9FUNG|nr:hypothetical protein IWQ60_004175 [Tieghemiomyces parasiticus]